jgi:hypothetical protein
VKHLRWVLFGLSVVCLIVVVMLTSSEMAEIRRSLPMLSRSMSWLERVWPDGPDIEHVVLFAGLGFSWRLLMLGTRGWVLFLVLVALALVTEVMQYMTIGRTPRWSDARDDVVGAALGLLLAVPVAALVRLVGGWARAGKEASAG